MFRSISFLALLALVVSLPLFLYGPMAHGHDAFEHFNYSKHFVGQFWGGELYPHWLLGIHHGLGSPTMFVFPPLPYYVSALLEPVAKTFHFSAFRATAFLSLSASGITALLWLQTMVARKAALVASVLYMLMPYHLTADFYRRYASPECWALVWIPLILYFSSGIVARKRGAVLGLAVAYALLIFSHPISAVMFSPVLLASILVLSPDGRKISSALRLAEGTLLGIGLSCVYLLPAIYHARYFPVSRLFARPEYQLTSHLIWFGKALFIHSEEGNFTRVIAFFVFDMVLLIAICGIFAVKAATGELRKVLTFWLAVSSCVVFLMLGVSYPVWRMLPKLHEAIQYPWRFNVVLCTAALPILAVFLSEISWKPRFGRIFVLSSVSMLVGVWLLSYGVILQRYKTETVVPTDPNHVVNESDGWFPAWTPPGLNQESALSASRGPQVRFIEGTGSANVSLWKPRHIEFQSNSLTGGWVMVNQFYYPEWKAKLGGRIELIETRSAMPEGLLETHVPPGDHQVLLEIPVGTAEHLGGWLSALSASLWLGWLVAVKAIDKLRTGESLKFPIAVSPRS